MIDQDDESNIKSNNYASIKENRYFKDYNECPKVNEESNLKPFSCNIDGCFKQFLHVKNYMIA